MSVPKCMHILALKDIFSKLPNLESDILKRDLDFNGFK